MHRNIHAAILLACSCVAGNVPAQLRSQRAMGDASSRTRPASDTVHSDLEVISNSIAGPLIDAISGQFGGRAVEMRLDALDARAINASDRAVSGTGDIQVHGRNGWIGFEFSLLYDGRLRQVVPGSSAWPVTMRYAR